MAGCPHESYVRDNHEQATVHAEQNAISDCAKRGVSCDNCEAYITHYPCLNCTKSLLSGGIKKIYYINDYNNDKLVSKFCEKKGCEISKLVDEYKEYRDQKAIYREAQEIKQYA